MLVRLLLFGPYVPGAESCECCWVVSFTEPPKSKTPKNDAPHHDGGGARGAREHLEHLECSLQPSPPGCFTKKLSEARGTLCRKLLRHRP